MEVMVQEEVTHETAVSVGELPGFPVLQIPDLCSLLHKERERAGSESREPLLAISHKAGS